MRVVLGTFLVVALAACGDDTGSRPSVGERHNIVATTSVLGDVVEEVVDGAADVEVVMPRGADPHDFAPSARQAEAMAEADLLVVNGAGFESGLESAIEAAADSGTIVFVATDHVQLRQVDGGDDPHFWTDPTRMVVVVEALADALLELSAGAGAGEYAEELRGLDAEIQSLVDGVPVERRVLVTNHEVLGYFAERYDFEVVGTVIPSLSTRAEASAADIEELADVIRAEDVPAIFTETSSSADLADVLADEVGDIDVVELFAESLAEEGSGAETYIEMQRTNATRITEALAA